MDNLNKIGHWVSVDGENSYKKYYQLAMKLLPEPVNIHDIVTSFGIVRVYEWSTDVTQERTPVLLLPGRSSGTPMWFKNLPDLLKERTVYSVDMLGDCGMSTQKAVLQNSDDQAEWLHQILDYLRLNKVHIVGHSFGGWAAANYASRYNQKIATMALLEPVFTFQWVRLSLLIKISFAMLPFWPKKWVEDTLLTIGGTRKEDIDPNDVMYRMIAEGKKHFKANLPQPVRISIEQIKSWNMPVYVAFGQNSTLHNSYKAYEIARSNINDLSGQVWPETTHSLPMEIPSLINAELLQFWNIQESVLR